MVLTRPVYDESLGFTACSGAAFHIPDGRLGQLATGRKPCKLGRPPCPTGRHATQQVLATNGLEWRNSLVEIAEADYIGGHLDTPSALKRVSTSAAWLAELSASRDGMENPIKLGETVTVVIPFALQPKGDYMSDEAQSGLMASSAGAKMQSLQNGVVVATAFSARWQGEAPRSHLFRPLLPMT